MLRECGLNCESFTQNSFLEVHFALDVEVCFDEAFVPRLPLFAQNSTFVDHP